MITFDDVHKSFGCHEVLKGIDAEIAKGQVVCLIGPSGSGKSTLLRCVNGLEGYQRGRISIDGFVVDAASPHLHAIRTRVSMVFQRFNLFPHRTALENVMEGPVYVLKEDRHEVRERAMALLGRVGLAEKTNSYTGRYRAANSSEWPSRVPWQCDRKPFSSTSLLRRSILRWWARCCRSCVSWRTTT